MDLVDDVKNLLWAIAITCVTIFGFGVGCYGLVERIRSGNKIVDGKQLPWWGPPFFIAAGIAGVLKAWEVWPRVHMEGITFLVEIICLVLLIIAIKDSQRRFLSVGYAVLGVVLAIVLGVASMFVLVPSEGSVIEINEVLDKIGAATSITGSIAAVWAANIPPRRVKA
jgi:hypothetical protein